MYMIIQKCSLWNVASVFLLEPTKVHFIKEISRKIKLSHTSVRLHLRTLLSEGLIKKVKAEPFEGYKADRENEEFLFTKKIFNLILLRECGLIEKLKEMYPKSIILFGSYERGEDIETSDIDLYIDSKKFDLKDKEKYEKILNRKIHLIFKDEPIEEIKKSIANGTILFGEKNG